MQTGESILLGLIIVMAVLIMAAYYWYYFTGWTDFSFNGTTPYAPGQSGSTPGWTASTGKNVSNIRFKKCVFTVVDPGGNTHSTDVTAVLNGMAVAYRGSTLTIPTVLNLDRPLNAFSFTISGVNDKGAVTADQVKSWANSATTLTGHMRMV